MFVPACGSVRPGLALVWYVHKAEGWMDSMKEGRNEIEMLNQFSYYYS